MARACSLHVSVRFHKGHLKSWLDFYQQWGCMWLPTGEHLTNVYLDFSHNYSSFDAKFTVSFGDSPLLAWYPWYPWYGFYVGS